MICYGHTRVQGSYIGPRHHIHGSCAAGIHRHVGKQAIVVEVVIQCHIVMLQCRCQQTVNAGSPALTGHVHVDGNIRTCCVVHHVCDVVVVGLRLPVGMAKEVLVRQRCNQSLGLCHVHVQGGIANIGGTIKNKRGLQHVLFGQP